jgi:hypothetical protein
VEGKENAFLKMYPRAGGMAEVLAHLPSKPKTQYQKPKPKTKKMVSGLISKNCINEYLGDVRAL